MHKEPYVTKYELFLSMELGVDQLVRRNFESELVSVTEETSVLWENIGLLNVEDYSRCEMARENLLENDF